MRTRTFRSLLVVLALACTQRAQAAPILAIDLDTSLAGIQSMLTVAAGSSLDLAVLAWDDGTGPPVLVDSVLLDVTTPGFGVAVLGAAAAAGPFADALTAVDAIGLRPVVSGTALTPIGPAGGASLGGPLGYFDCPSGVPTCLAPPPAPGAALPIGMAGATTLVAFSATAGAAGSEALSIGMFPIGFGGAPLLDTTLLDATLTVEAAATMAPEPTPALLLAAGLLALAAGARRRRA